MLVLSGCGQKYEPQINACIALSEAGDYYHIRYDIFTDSDTLHVLNANDLSSELGHLFTDEGSYGNVAHPLPNNLCEPSEFRSGAGSRATYRITHDHRDEVIDILKNFEFELELTKDGKTVKVKKTFELFTNP